MTKVMQNSVLTSSTALNRLILRRCEQNSFSRIVSDSSVETNLTKLLAINYNYFPLVQNLRNNRTTLFPVTQYYGNPMPSIGSISYI